MKIFFLTIAVVIYCNTFSQKFDNVWVFGDGAGLNFNTDVPNFFYTNTIGYEANASISDDSGNLIFYTNGQNVWDNENNLMPNGDSLHIGGLSYVSEIEDAFSSSITQGVIIIPMLKSENLFYIFHLQGGAFIGAQYSIVDMNLNAGLGDVTEKNLILTTDTLQEKMQAVKHANGRDWWLIVRKWINHETDVVFSKYLITPDGINGPFDQNYGPDYNWDDDNDIGWGQMIFSQNGEKLLNVRGKHLDLYDFDRCTGEFSNHYPILDIVQGFSSLYSCSFSQDGSKIYTSALCGGNKKIFQYCLNCDYDIIDSSQQLIYEGPDGSFCLGQEQLGPNGKIYIAIGYNELPNDVFNSKNQNLSVINFPNEEYPLCNFDTNTISLGGSRTIYGLPNMPNYNLGKLEGSPCDTVDVSIHIPVNKTEIFISPNPAQTYFYLSGHDAAEVSAIELFSIAGSSVKKFTDISSSALYVGDLNAGMYLCKIQTRQGRIIFEKLEIIK